MTATSTRTIELGAGRSVEVTLAEAGTGRTALVLHGGGGPATVQGIAAHLSGAMGVLTPVHPGWDGTSRPQWLSAISDLAAVYLRLLRDEGLRDVLVVGSSIGGWIGAERRRLLLRRPGHRATGAGCAAGRQHDDHARLRR